MWMVEASDRRDLKTAALNRRGNRSDTADRTPVRGGSKGREKSRPHTKFELGSLGWEGKADGCKRWPVRERQASRAQIDDLIVHGSFRAPEYLAYRGQKLWGKTMVFRRRAGRRGDARVADGEAPIKRG